MVKRSMTGLEKRDAPQSATVLIVDDEPLLRMNAADYFTDEGYETIEASSADEALALLEKRSDIGFVFSDVHMPGTMDGVGLSHIISARWPHIRLVLTSGKANPSNLPLPHHVIFLAKPYNLPAVVRLAMELPVQLGGSLL